MSKVIFKFLTVAGLALSLSSTAFAQQSNVLLNVSYDVSRGFYKDYNPKFIANWKNKTGKVVQIRQSHSGSSKQARAVADGLGADVVTMNQSTDISFLAKQGLVAKDWAKKFPNNASPYTSSIVFVVRKGNPKHIKDWRDLAKSGLGIIFPNPKNSGTGRYAYLAAWGWALQQPQASDKSVTSFMQKIIKNVALLPTSGRDATTTFLQRGQGDVLLTLESEAGLIAKEFGHGNFDVVYPSSSILANFPVALVEKPVNKHGTRQLAQAYLEYLWSKDGQELAAKNYLRPTNSAILKQHAKQFPALKTFSVPQVFGSWDAAFSKHFKAGGSFDKLYQAN